MAAEFEREIYKPPSRLSMAGNDLSLSKEGLMPPMNERPDRVMTSIRKANPQVLLA